MQIGELGKNGRNIRGMGDAVGKAKQKMQGEAVPRNERERVPEESFQESLQKSMNMGLAAEWDAAAARAESECGDLSSIGTKHRGKDISSFLNDDEL